MLLYEAGESLRFDGESIQLGIDGIFSVMRTIGMLPSKSTKSIYKPRMAKSSHWIRASQGGIFRQTKGLGEKVKAGDELGILADPFGQNKVPVKSIANGIIIGVNNLPLVNQGDAIFHVACWDPVKRSTRIKPRDVELNQ